jgi:D-arginine dehydrogenase
MPDFIVIGSGIAAASAAFFLADHGKVILLDRDAAPTPQPGDGPETVVWSAYHREPACSALLTCSRAFFETHAPPLSSPLVRLEQLEQFSTPQSAPARCLMTARDAHALCSTLRVEKIEGALYETDALDIDVEVLRQGFLSGLSEKGSAVVYGATVHGIFRSSRAWRVLTAATNFTAPILVNAAGAWCDEVAKAASIRPVGIASTRRTAFALKLPNGDMALGALSMRATSLAGL